jgi:exonuclease III
MPRLAIAVLVLLLLASLAVATVPWGGRADQALKIATWNLEWLVTPATAQAGRLACLAGRRAPLPCDVALEHARDSADLARLAAYARRADADVIAFQEVENAAIARRIFPGYDICIATGRGVQHVGFAVRRPLPHRCGRQLAELSLGGVQRAGQTLLLFPGTAAEVELLGVHLKSGCADHPLDSGDNACALLARQAAVLQSWVEPRARRNARFILLGDFNRGDDDFAQDEFWRLLAGDDPLAPFQLAGSGTPFHNCHVGAPFTRGIDHILVSRALEKSVVPGSFRKLPYASLDAMRYRLADHCPVRISLNLPGDSTTKG